MRGRYSARFGSPNNLGENMDITGMLAIGKGEKCLFCEFIIDDDTLGHLIENHKEDVNKVLFGDNNE